jgi:hypothetical protein
MPLVDAQHPYQTVISVNGALPALTGFSEAEVVGRCLHKLPLLQSLLNSSQWRVLQKAIASGSNANGEMVRTEGQQPVTVFSCTGCRCSQFNKVPLHALFQPAVLLCRRYCTGMAGACQH